jgi:hypothetical protein
LEEKRMQYDSNLKNENLCVPTKDYVFLGMHGVGIMGNVLWVPQNLIKRRQVENQKKVSSLGI